VALQFYSGPAGAALSLRRLQAVKICTKKVNRRRQEPKIRVFEQIFNKAVSEKKILDSST
jgi:hypothetical protein